MKNELNELLLDSFYTKQKKYWTTKLENTTKTDFKDSVYNKHGNEIQIIDSLFPRELSMQITKLSKNSDLLVYIILLTGLKGLLNRYFNDENVSIISPTYNPLISNQTFNNHVLISNNIKGTDGFKDLLKQTKQAVTEAYENQDYPFERILEAVNLKEDISKILCMFSPIHKEHEKSPFKANLELKYTLANDEIHVSAKYNTGIYSQEKINQLITHHKEFLANALKEIETPIQEIEYIPEEEKHQLLFDFNNTTTDFPKNKTVIDLFEENVKKYPQNNALIFGDKRLKYSEFSEKVNQVANGLIANGIAKGDVVGLMSERSFEMMVGIFAILKAGGVYLPIDPNYPEERIKYIINNSKPKIILSQEKFKELGGLDFEFISLENEAFNDYSKELDQSNCSPDDLAYVIYTSGSTGNPKGAMIAHDALVNRVNWMGKAYPISHKDVLIQKTTIVFDVSVWELFWWAVDGASLFLLNPEEEKYPNKIIEEIERNNVSVIHFVPSVLHVFLDEFEDFEYSRLKTLKYVFSSGEALEKIDVKKFNETLYKENQTQLINLYGPTEATIDVTYFNCSPMETFDIIPIGKPIDNIKLSIVDNNNKHVPVGVSGELCISGVGVAKGYLNNEKLTKEKFVPCLFEKERHMYKTGDLVRWLPDGNIEFLGRLDSQIKIRGYRIELGEIECKLSSHDKIDKAVVLDIDEGIDKILVAYYLSEEKEDKDELQKYLLKKLPYYMIPVHFIHLEKFPLTNNGKVDKKALLKLDFSIEKERIPPKNEMELQIVKIWAEVLNIEIDKIGINDGFFELGGNSIKILKLTRSINQAFNCNLTVAEIFDKNRIIDLVEFIQSGEDKSIIDIEKEVDESVEERNQFLNIESLLD